MQEFLGWGSSSRNGSPTHEASYHISYQSNSYDIKCLHEWFSSKQQQCTKQRIGTVRKQITLPIAFESLLPLSRSWRCISNACFLGYPQPFFGEMCWLLIDHPLALINDHDISCVTFNISYMSVFIIINNWIGWSVHYQLIWKGIFVFLVLGWRKGRRKDRRLTIRGRESTKESSKELTREVTRQLMMEFTDGKTTDVSARSWNIFVWKNFIE